MIDIKWHAFILTCFSNTTRATSRAGTAYPTGAKYITFGLCGVSVSDPRVFYLLLLLLVFLSF